MFGTRPSPCLAGLFSVLLLSAVGCALFQDSSRLEAKKAAGLPPIPTSRDAIQLEIVFVERPVDDPLLGSLLWRQIDQVSALSPEKRSILRGNGFQIGHVSSNPPRPLQTLLGLTTEISDSETDEARRMVGRRIVLQSGAATEVQTSDLYPACSISIASDEGVETQEFEYVRCVFRVFVERMQDGWAKLEFLPEIHHDAARLRATATDSNWQLRSRQEIEKLYGHRFSMELNVGEMAVLTAEQGAALGSLGRCFFVGAEPSADKQRLLVIRLADMKKVDPVYAE